ncbi:MAG: uncharacterized membrane protein YgdD (TMEM256/DUF423 family) [Flavobacteriales bacterium]|jgi:uncharacterized membrane protein YgdD (TMEM256/DUF423 family)
MIKYHKKIVISASVLAAVAITLGAFGAHGLKQLISVESLAIFETGVTYQMYHALALLALGLNAVVPSKTIRVVFRFFVFGILFFSGSLYFLALKSIMPFSVSFLGPVTPVGGLLLILGWARLIYGVLKKK